MQDPLNTLRAMSALPANDLLAKIESHAAKLAREAGKILSSHFEGLLEVDYKDEGKQDPVTEADKRSQDFLVEGIRTRFPDHAVLGEEDDEDADDETRLPDFVWALDPLDGTKNFVGGLPVYACSVGVLYRGVPVVGAVYVPWPGGAGEVMHARSGGGAFLEGEPVSVRESDGTGGKDLVALPSSFGSRYRLSPSATRGLGEPRVTGSIAHELAMTAKGVFEYTVIGGAHFWDVAAGMVLVKEAGGAVMLGRHRTGLGLVLSTRTSWEPLDSVVEDWSTTKIRDLRRWSAPLLLGSPDAICFLAENLRSRRRLGRRLVLAIRGRR